jgi:hypothetical protein
MAAPAGYVPTAHQANVDFKTDINRRIFAYELSTNKFRFLQKMLSVPSLKDKYIHFNHTFNIKERLSDVFVITLYNSNEKRIRKLIDMKAHEELDKLKICHITFHYDKGGVHHNDTPAGALHITRDNVNEKVRLRLQYIRDSRIPHIQILAEQNPKVLHKVESAFLELVLTTINELLPGIYFESVKEREINKQRKKGAHGAAVEEDALAPVPDDMYQFQDPRLFENLYAAGAAGSAMGDLSKAQIDAALGAAAAAAAGAPAPAPAALGSAKSAKQGKKGAKTAKQLAAEAAAEAEKANANALKEAEALAAKEKTKLDVEQAIREAPKKEEEGMKVLLQLVYGPIGQDKRFNLIALAEGSAELTTELLNSLIQMYIPDIHIPEEVIKMYIDDAERIPLSLRQLIYYYDIIKINLSKYTKEKQDFINFYKQKLMFISPDTINKIRKQLEVDIQNPKKIEKFTGVREVQPKDPLQNIADYIIFPKYWPLMCIYGEPTQSEKSIFDLYVRTTNIIFGNQGLAITVGDAESSIFDTFRHKLLFKSIKDIDDVKDEKERQKVVRDQIKFEANVLEAIQKIGVNNINILYLKFTNDAGKTPDKLIQYLSRLVKDTKLFMYTVALSTAEFDPDKFIRYLNYDEIKRLKNLKPIDIILQKDKNGEEIPERKLLIEDILKNKPIADDIIASQKGKYAYVNAANGENGANAANGANGSAGTQANLKSLNAAIARQAFVKNPASAAGADPAGRGGRRTYKKRKQYRKYRTMSLKQKY